MICLMYFLIKPVNNGEKIKIKKKSHRSKAILSNPICTAVSIDVAVQCGGFYFTSSF